MISNKPYIIRAMHEWIVDNKWTPHVQINANYPGVDVPSNYVRKGVIVLNIDPSAIVGLSMDNRWFTFKARFKGVETTLGFPPEAVSAIFAHENGEGMSFPPEVYPDAAKQGELKKKPRLVVVENETKAPLEDDPKLLKNLVSKKKPTLSVVK